MYFIFFFFPFFSFRTHWIHHHLAMNRHITYTRDYVTSVYTYRARACILRVYAWVHHTCLCMERGQANQLSLKKTRNQAIIHRSLMCYLQVRCYLSPTSDRKSRRLLPFLWDYPPFERNIPASAMLPFVYILLDKKTALKDRRDRRYLTLRPKTIRVLRMTEWSLLTRTQRLGLNAKSA